MRVPQDHTDRARDPIDVELGLGQPSIDLAARLAPVEPVSIRARLTRRRASGLRERLGRPASSPVR